MLVYQQDANILPLAGELLKGALDGRGLGLLIHDEVVFLAVGGIRNMLIIRVSQPMPTPPVRSSLSVLGLAYSYSGEENASYGVLWGLVSGDEPIGKF